MKRALVASFSLLSLPKCNGELAPSLAPLTGFARSVLRSYSSSESNGSPGEPNTAQTSTQNPDVTIDDSISNEGIKQKIEKFYEGDGEALPSIFEAILKRKLAGRSDDELMEGLNLPANDIKDLESDSELDELLDSDEETDDFDELHETDKENAKE
uniref:Uncharacterized protein n=1 Tax=Rhizophora mucronata TaxID=61149 RepID=A0A2P2P258_RHIMU